MDTVTEIIRFENGEMDTIDEVVEFFEHLKTSGLLWNLQGMYQRTYFRLKENGYID